MVRRGCTMTMVALVLALGQTAVVSAGETAKSHSGHPQKMLLVDEDRLAPDDLTMGKEDVLVVFNQSLAPMVFTFTEPKDAPERIHCELIHRDRGKKFNRDEAAWMLFEVQDGQLQASIPPGHFASLCSLDPGQYVYTASQEFDPSGAIGAGGGRLPLKGQITVR
jgi:hypothetical protein